MRLSRFLICEAGGEELWGQDEQPRRGPSARRRAHQSSRKCCRARACSSETCMRNVSGRKPPSVPVGHARGGRTRPGTPPAPVPARPGPAEPACGVAVSPGKNISMHGTHLARVGNVLDQVERHRLAREVGELAAHLLQALAGLQVALVRVVVAEDDGEARDVGEGLERVRVQPTLLVPVPDPRRHGHVEGQRGGGAHQRVGGRPAGGSAVPPQHERERRRERLRVHQHRGGGWRVRARGAWGVPRGRGPPRLPPAGR